MRTVELDRKQRDFMLRRSDILKAAERVFAIKGYHRATMADIAEEAQYGVGTIYLYFKDKQTLYINLLEEKMEQLLSSVQEKVDRTNNAFGKISVLVKTQLEFFLSNEDFFRIYFSERGGVRLKIKDEVPASFVKLFFRFLDYTAGIIRGAQDQGIIKKDYEPQRLSFFLSSIIKSIIMPRLIDSTKPREDIMDQCSFILDVFLHGVGTNR